MLKHYHVAKFRLACHRIMRECPNEYAKGYAKAGYWMEREDEIRAQALYILSNMSHWRGLNAKVCRKVLKEIAGERP